MLVVRRIEHPISLFPELGKNKRGVGDYLIRGRSDQGDVRHAPKERVPVRMANDVTTGGDHSITRFERALGCGPRATSAEAG